MIIKRLKSIDIKILAIPAILGYLIEFYRISSGDTSDDLSKVGKIAYLKIGQLALCFLFPDLYTEGDMGRILW